VLHKFTPANALLIKEVRPSLVTASGVNSFRRATARQKFSTGQLMNKKRRAKTTFLVIFVNFPNINVTQTTANRRKAPVCSAHTSTICLHREAGRGKAYCEVDSQNNRNRCCSPRCRSWRSSNVLIPNRRRCQANCSFYVVHDSHYMGILAIESEN